MTNETNFPIEAIGGEKTILITGASRGLGRSMAEHLVRAGHFVIGTFRSAESEARDIEGALAEAPGKIRFLSYDARTSDPKQFAEEAGAIAAEGRSGRIDALVANAGIGIHASFMETSPEQFDELTAIQFKAPFFLAQALAPTLSDGGRILFVSSGLARFALPGYAAYASSKGAIEVLARYLAVELGQRGIRVNCVAPGAIETDFSGGAVRDNSDLNAAVAGMTALGRVGKPDDIGAAVAALLSDDMQWMTGQRVEVSGGMRL